MARTKKTPMQLPLGEGGNNGHSESIDEVGKTIDDLEKSTKVPNLNEEAVRMLGLLPEKDESLMIAQKNSQPDLVQNSGMDGINLITDKYHRASCLRLTKEEEIILSEPIDTASIEIRPDGLIYYPQVFARNKLNQAFGRGQWALIEHQVKHDEEHNKIYFEGSLYIRGHFVSKAWGENQYYPKKRDGTWNPRFSMASVHESAKSDCIVRCCKDLSIGKECWEPLFVRNWIQMFAVKVWRHEEQEFQWRRKDSPPFYDEDPNYRNKDKKPEKSPAPTKAKETKNPSDQKSEPKNQIRSKTEAEYKEALKQATMNNNMTELQLAWASIPADIKEKLQGYKDTCKEQIRSTIVKTPLTILSEEKTVLNTFDMIKTKKELSEFIGLNAEVIEVLYKKFPAIGTAYKQVSVRLNK